MFYTLMDKTWVFNQSEPVQCCSLLVMLKFLLNLAPEPEPEPEPEMAEYRGSFLCG